MASVFRTWGRALTPWRRWLSQVTAASLRADALAGLTGAAIVLPQGVAFATIAGLPPQYGIYTAMVTAFVAALFGSSMVMVSGPTTALSVVLFTTLAPLAPPGSPRFVELALLMTIMVGAVQVVAAIARLGAMVSFVSHSVMTGFTAAAALLIAVSQLGPALGIRVEPGGSVPDRLAHLLGAAGEASAAALAVAGLALVSVTLIQGWSRRAPGFLAALVLGGLLAALLAERGETIAMVGALPSAFPAFHVPRFTPSDAAAVTQGVVAVALIGLLEAVSIGRAMALRRRERFDAGQEMFGQGLSNLAGGFFQCYVGSGSFTRSGINLEVGARTPLAAMFSSLFLALILLLVLPLIAHIPVPAMAGLILYVAWRLIDWREIRHILRSSRSETAVLALTFASGLLIELDFAVYVGVIASLVAFLRRTSQPVVSIVAPKLVNGVRKFVAARDISLPECPQITMLRIDGALYFGSFEYVERMLRRIEREHPQQRIRVLILKGVGDIDLAGADLLIDEARSARARGGDLLLIAQEPLVSRLERLGVTAELGEGAVHASKAEAIVRAVAKADNEICRSCRLRIFHECAGKPGARAALRELGY